MEYQDLVDKVGMRFDIVEGELRESPSGLFLCSTTYQPYSIYLNKQTRQYSIIAPNSSYLGRKYQLRKRDCITLIAEWLDNNYSSNFSDYYYRFSNKQFVYYYKNGMSLWFEDNGFQKVNDYQEGDCLVYKYREAVISHAGIYLNNNRILHHLPDKLSCIDAVDSSKVLGIYRYANKNI